MLVEHPVFDTLVIHFIFVRIVVNFVFYETARDTFTGLTAFSGKLLCVA